MNIKIIFENIIPDGTKVASMVWLEKQGG